MIEYSFGWKHAGLISIWGESKRFALVFHFFPSKEFWIWGVKKSYYDGAPLIDFGFGPLFLVVYQDID